MNATSYRAILAADASSTRRLAAACRLERRRAPRRSTVEAWWSAIAAAWLTRADELRADAAAAELEDTVARQLDDAAARWFLTSTSS